MKSWRPTRPSYSTTLARCHLSAWSSPERHFVTGAPAQRARRQIAGEGDGTGTEVANILRPRHRHHRYADDPAPLPLGFLTTRAWQAAQQALNGDEAAARALFDDIRKIVNELDRLNFSQEEYIERWLAEANARTAQLSAEVVEEAQNFEQLRHQIDSIRASICWRLTWPIRWFHKLLTRGRSV
jgi:hypothetical protein